MKKLFSEIINAILTALGLLLLLLTLPFLALGQLWEDIFGLPRFMKRNVSEGPKQKKVGHKEIVEHFKSQKFKDSLVKHLRDTGQIPKE